MDLVAIVVQGLGTFDLDAPDAAAGVEDEVVTLAVAPGLGDGESQAGGFDYEGGFGELSGALGVGMLAGLVFFVGGIGLGVQGGDYG